MVSRAVLNRDYQWTSHCMGLGASKVKFANSKVANNPAEIDFFNVLYPWKHRILVIASCDYDEQLQIT